MKIWIGEHLTDASERTAIPVTNPYDGSLIDTVPDATQADVNAAVACACEAQKDWARVPVYEKVDLVQEFLRLVQINQEDLALTLTYESGKTISESRNEIRNIFTAWTAFSEKAKHLYGSILPPGLERGQEHNLVLTVREPVGVVSCIIPFNFPCNLFNQKAAPALLSGNAVIVKPSSEDPLTVCKLVGLLHQAGFPRGVIQVLTGRGNHTGNALCSHPQVHAVSLTGSTKVGISVAERTAASLKKTALELGGNDAFIVLADADLALAVKEAVKARFYYAGQICCAPKRFLIHRSYYEDFLAQAARYANALQAGDPKEEQTQISTLISEAAAEEVEQQIRRTLRRGAALVTGGKREGAFVEPTILRDVPRGAEILHDMEVFGPVMPVIAFDTEEEALSLANDTQYGLGGSVFTKDLSKVIRFSRELSCGSVVINGSSYFRSFEMPFGGWSKSGMGTEGVFSTFEEMTRIKCISVKGML